MEKRIVTLFLAPFLLFWHWFEPSARRNQKGIRAYSEKKYDQALQHFLSAKGRKPDASALKNNTASTLYQLKKYQEAMEEFSRIQTGKGTAAQADQYYNLGNTAFRQQQWDKALDYYKKCLLSHPEDIEAKKNYELTLKKLQEQQQQQPQPNQSQQQNTDQNQQYNPLMQFLNQNEKEQIEKKKRPLQKQKREKDW